MLNLRGEVAGLITAIATQGGGNEGVAFVLPVKIVRRIAEQLVRDGSAVKPFLGCGFDPVFAKKDRNALGIDRNIGARINKVIPDTPAARDGLKTGDVILAFNGTEVEDDKHIVNLVAESEVNKPAVLKINREGNTVEITVVLGEQVSR
ncbi:MAG: S1C family serine protease, partial [Planctomycetaceae bacterium]|jgi:serine protease Do|nr:S1C family serine protease [Planctomycetaceae bacterium]